VARSVTILQTGLVLLLLTAAVAALHFFSMSDLEPAQLQYRMTKLVFFFSALFLTALFSCMMILSKNCMSVHSGKYSFAFMMIAVLMIFFDYWYHGAPVQQQLPPPRPLQEMRIRSPWYPVCGLRH